jgi:hypothetical protein
MRYNSSVLKTEEASAAQKTAPASAEFWNTGSPATTGGPGCTRRSSCLLSLRLQAVAHPDTGKNDQEEVLRASQDRWDSSVTSSNTADKIRETGSSLHSGISRRRAPSLPARERSLRTRHLATLLALTSTLRFEV